MVTKEFQLFLDAVEKPYYCCITIQTSDRLTTTALLGLAPVLSTPASAAITGKASAARQHDDSGAAKQ